MANPQYTRSDVGWTLLFMALLLPLMSAGMFVSAAYLTPAVLGSPNSMPRHGIEAAVEARFLFGGMLLGIAAALALFGFLTRRYLSKESYERWDRQFENGASKLPRTQRGLGRFLIKYLKPRD